MPGPSRVEDRAAGSSAIRRWLLTAPFFCDRPVRSSVVQALPSRCAAIASTAPTVTTPVPPMPVISTFQVPSIARQLRQTASVRSPRPRPCPVSGLPPSTVTKLGQKPFTQE